MRRPRPRRPGVLTLATALALALVLALALALAPPAAAKPTTSTIEELLTPETAVLVARIERMPPAHEGKPFTLRVERVVRGSHRPGELLSFLKPGCTSCQAGSRILAFVDKSRHAWTATGLLLAGPAIEDGVLRMEAWSAWNAHSVVPTLIPFPRLEALLTREAPLYPQVRGPLVVNGPAGLTPTSIQVHVPAPGLPDLAQGLAPPPGGPPHDQSYYSAENGVLVSATWNSGVRSVDLVGEVLGVHEDRADIDAAFLLVRPAHLDEASLRRYLSDPDCPEPRYAFEIRTATARLPLVLPASPDRAAPGTLDGRPVTAFSLAPGRIESAAARLAFAPDPAARNRAALSDSARLVSRLLHAPAPCELARGPEKRPRTPSCTLHYLGIQFPPPMPPAPPVPPWPDVK